MRAGKLDRTIMIERLTETVSATGAVSSAWTNVATIRAEAVQQTTTEFLTGFGETENGTIVFRVRYLAGITTADRVTYAGQIYDLKEVTEIGRKRGLELRGSNIMTHLRGLKPALSPDREALTKAPPAPKWMTAEARAEWKRIMPRLIADRIITKADLTGVENYCVATGRVREIERLFSAGGLDKTLFGMQNRAMQTARQLAAEYGLSPVSRARVGSASTNDDDDDNPLTVT